MFVTMVTKSLKWSLCWVRLIQSTPPWPFFCLLYLELLKLQDIKCAVSLQCIYTSCHMTYQIYCPAFSPCSFIKSHGPYFVVPSSLHTPPQPPPSITRPYVTASPSCRWSPHPPRQLYMPQYSEALLCTIRILNVTPWRRTVLLSALQTC